MSELWLGLDLGTQNARALAVSADGEILAVGSHPLRSRREGPRHEQEPEDWWEAIAAACRSALAELAGEAVTGLALCATSGTIALVDSRGDPLSAGLMYDDGRACEEARRAGELGGELWDSLGYRPQPSWALPKLLWLLGSHGELPGGARLAHQADFVTRRLVGGQLPADSSHALKTGYDLLNDVWPVDLMRKLGVPEGLLPEVVRPGSILGSVCAAAAEATAIPEGTPVIAGMTDGCAAQLAAGALGVGSWNSVLGTTLVLKGVAPQPVRDPSGTVYSHRSPDGNWLPGGASSVGAGVLSERFPDRDLAELDRRAAEREPAGVLAYPLRSGGERFPFAAAEAEGFLIGKPAGEVDHYAALLQGVAYVERLCFDHLDRLAAPIGGDLSLTGGGARSRYWCQLRADVLGRQVRLPESAEGALGMAVLAASTERPLSETAARMVRVREVIDPRPDRIDRFREPYRRFVDELERRGWLDPGLAEHARARAAA